MTTTVDLIGGMVLLAIFVMLYIVWPIITRKRPK